MTRWISKLQGSPTRTEAQEFFDEAYPLPVAGFAVVALLLGDIAVVIAAVAAVG
jgi:hypothetical protein